MIEDYELRKLLKENNLTFPRRVRDDLKKDADLNEVEEILAILRRLNIPSNIIEKYPRILYVSSENVKNNYKLLRDNKLYNYNSEELIKVLLCDQELVKTNFDNISRKYNTYEINKNILVLQSQIQYVRGVEKYSQILTPEILMAASISGLTGEEIYDVVLTCLRSNIAITPNVFKRTSNEIRSIIKICKDRFINVTDSLFTKSPKELEEILKMCDRLKITFYNDLAYCPMDKIESLLSSFIENKVEIKEVLSKTSSENIKEILSICERFNLDVDYKVLSVDVNKVLKIIEICNNYNVKVSRNMFNRTLTDIEDIIRYCKDKNIIVRDTYFLRTKREIENIHNSFDLSIKRDDTTYKRDLKEIIDIKVFCDTSGMKFTPVLLNNNIDEIEKIIETCKKRHIEVTPGVFKTKHRDLDRIISILKQQPLVWDFTTLACNRTPYEVKRIKEIVIDTKVRKIPEMFLRTPYEVERIIKLTKSSLDAKYFQHPLSKVEEIFSFCNTRGLKMKPNMLNRTTGEIEDIIEICNNKGIEITDSVYLRTPFELEEIINYCEDKKMEITGDCFVKKPEQFKEAVKTCEELNIPAVGAVFNRTPDEIRTIAKLYEKLDKKPINSSFNYTPEDLEEIIRLAAANNVKITSELFSTDKKPKQIETTINYVKKKFGQDFLLPQIVIFDKDHIDRIFAYCGGRGYLETIKTCPYILKLSLEEIVERDAYLNSIGGRFVEDGKFNQIFLWSRKKFLEVKEKQIQEQSGNGSKK